MKWSDAKRELKKKSQGDLLSLVKSLFDLSPDNRSFIATLLDMGGDNTLGYYEAEISEAVNPHWENPIDLRRGRKAISSYKKAAPHDCWGTMNLMLHFLEQGAEQTLTYGDIDASFYKSMCSMADSILEYSAKLDSTQIGYLARRFDELNSRTEDQIGWGFSDHITDINCEIQELLAAR